ncbi:MAG: adenine phosphoribosyltransferase [Planctomycetota bacterium]
MDLKEHIRSIRDFPTAGIVFRDICPLLRDPKALRGAVDQLTAPFAEDQIDVVVAPEARGFVFGSAVAYHLGAGFVMVRKPGKLPAETIETTYQLEYGTDTVTMHRDSIGTGDRVLLLDDLLATGGTISACCELVEELGGDIVGLAFLIELSFLNGRDRLDGYRVVSLIDYESE